MVEQDASWSVTLSSQLQNPALQNEVLSHKAKKIIQLSSILAAITVPQDNQEPNLG